VSTFTSTASTLLSGVDAVVDSVFADSSLGLGFLVRSVSSSSSLDSELVWAPPVLTTTPGGDCVVVDPVEVDGWVGSEVGSVGAVVGFAFGSAEADASVDVDVSVDVDSVGDDSEDSDEGVSAHATGSPYPVTTATPTPRATAKPPTRPT
jgi:hypothetical protein